MIRRFSQDERGFAMAAVVLLGSFLIMLSVVIIFRSMSTSNIVADDRQWDQSLPIAESGVDYALAELQINAAFNTAVAYADVDTRDEVIAEALALAMNPSHPAYAEAVHETGEGLSVVVKPHDADIVYGVAFTPDLDTYNQGIGKARVVVSELGRPYWTPQQAILVGGPAKIEAKKDDKDIDLTCSSGAPAGCTAGGGWIHFNGQVEWKEDKTENNITGCFTVYGAPDTVFKDNGDDRKDPDKLDGPYTNDDDTAYPYCPNNNVQDAIGEFEHDGDIPYIPIPEIDPMAVHYLAQYEVCPDGIRWGPNGDTSPYWPGAGTTTSLPTFPCTGDQLTGPYPDGKWLLGIKNGVELGHPPTDDWDKRIEFEKEVVDGIFFLWGRSAKLKKVKGDVDRYWTIIAAKPPMRDEATHAPIAGGDLSCLGKDDTEVWNPKELKWDDFKKEMYGDIEIEVENDDIYPYGWTGDPENPGEGKGYLIVTSGDLKLKVKGKKDLPDPGDIFGIMAVHEQMRVESSDADEGKGAIYGALIAQDACDTKDSLHRDKVSEFKKGDIIYDGSFATTDFVIEDTTAGEFRVATTDEF